MIEFAQPGFLWALPALAVPVIIHLLNRRRYRRVQWAAMTHLVRAEKRSRRRILWQNVLLLALRSAAVALLVLLFSQPVLSRPLPGLTGRGRTAVGLLLDDSSSMAQVRGGISAFDRAKAFALSASEAVAGTGSSVTAWLTSREEPMFEAAPMQPEDVRRLRAELDGLRPTASVFEPGEQLPYLAAQQGGRGAGQLPEQCFYVLTDLRAADWGADALDASAARGLEALQKRGPVLLVDVGTEAGENAGITEVRGVDRPAYAQSTSVLRLVLQNDGPEPLASSAVDVRLDGRPLPPASVPSIPAGESREVPLELFFDRPGYHCFEASLRLGDSFAPDDRRFVALEAVEWLPVLVVEGDGASGQGRSAGYYLRTALQPVRGARSGIRVDVQNADSGPPPNLGSYGAVFMCDVRSPAAWQGPLGRYVEEGGRVVVFLGDSVDADAWNATFGASGGLMPCRLGTRVNAAPGSAFRLSRLELSHPLLSPFSEWETLFGMPRFTCFCRAELLSDALVLAKFDDADSSAAIVVGRKGSGLVVLFTSSADDEWTDWPRSEVGRITYLSLVQWLVEHGRAAVRPQTNLAGGGRIEFRLDSSRFRPDASLVLPASGLEAVQRAEPLRARPHADREGLWFVSDPLKLAGIWVLQLSGRSNMPQVGSSLYFAVNVPEKERVLARTRPELVLAAQSSPGRLQLLPYDGASAKSVLSRASAPVGYWPLVAGLVLCALVCESALAYVLGNPGRLGRRFAGGTEP